MLKFSEMNSQLTATGASDNVARHIRALIFSGQLAPGERLPTGVDLARGLGISVVTLRVALKSLESTGYIVTSRGAHGGTQVNDVRGLTKCWIEWAHENEDDLDDIFEICSTIEMRLAALAAERRTEDELHAIEAASTLPVGPDSPVLPWNVAFHHAVGYAAHSKRLGEALVAVEGKLFLPFDLAPVAAEGTPLLPIDLAEYNHQVHELRTAHAAILDAIRDRDPHAAAESMGVDLAKTEAVFKWWLGLKQAVTPVAQLQSR